MKNKPRYAEVVVLTTLDRRPTRIRPDEPATTLLDFNPATYTFTYGIPPNRRGLLQPGQVVWAPFGRSRQQAVILRLVDTAPEGVHIKVLGDPVTSGPALTPAQIELAHWLATTYLAPLSECVRLMLPPGFGARLQVMVEHVPGAPTAAPDLSPAQQALLLHLAQHGPLPLRELRTLDRRLAQEDVLGKLLSEGLVRLRDRVQGAKPPAPKKERLLEPAMAAPALDEALLRGGRRSRLADLLLWLQEQPQQQATVAAARQATRSSAAIVRQACAKGWVQQEGERLHLLLDKAALRDTVYALRGTQSYAAVLQALQKLGPGPVPEAQVKQAAPGVKPAQIKRMIELGLLRMIERQLLRDPLAGAPVYPDTPPTLTPDQQKAWQRIEAGLAEWLGEDAPAPPAQPPVYVLHGVTGSGKTELYLRALQQAVAGGRQGIVLVPEISLTPQTVRRFMARFPGRVAVLHSKLSAGERYDTWQRARQGDFDIVVGSRSALFMPFPRLGVIVVDEEHDAAYKQIRTPRYHARDTAIALARLSGAVTLLGSATPALETTFQTRRGRYIGLALPRRVRGHRQPGSETALPEMLELPEVTVVDMRAELRAGNRSMFSRELHQALQDVLQRQEQAILFLNRRGSATFVMCRDCGEVLHCPRCGVPLTYHGFGDQMICHHCNYRQIKPRVCPKCKSPRFKEFGAGTQRLVDALLAEFPQARPLRWDRDTTGGKTSHETILQDFIEHKADVLVGTQMIAKGLDLPLVTLVGVISADVGLFLPDFRAGERVFQVLTQVAGRAGRSALGGRVIFQTYQPQHYAILAASHHDYDSFYRQEMQFRQEQGYPPYRRLTRMLYLDTDRNRCLAETQRVAKLLLQRAKALDMDDVSLIGPAPAFFAKERGKFRWHILIRTEDPGKLLAGIALRPNWRIDVDPVDAL